MARSDKQRQATEAQRRQWEWFGSGSRLEENMYTEEELEWLKAVDKYKEENHRPFPSLTELLKVLKSLGYRKDA